jgi:YD repeat-containing protein
MGKTIKHDKQGRVILEKINPPGMTYRYKYDSNKRIVNIRLDSDSKLNRTIIHQEKIEDVFKTVLKKEFTDKFIITTTYDSNGRVLKIKRRNRKGNKSYVRENLVFKDKEPVIWLEKTKKSQDFGFKVDVREFF